MADLTVANQILAAAGMRTSLAVIDNNTPEGYFIGLLYDPLRNYLLRSGEFDCALVTDTAVAAGAAEAPFTLAWNIPAGALRVRQVLPTPLPADPQPTIFSVSNGKIRTAVAISHVVSTKSIAETLWDAEFREAFVRLAASSISYAQREKLDFTKMSTADALGIAQLASGRDG